MRVHTVTTERRRPRTCWLGGAAAAAVLAVLGDASRSLPVPAAGPSLARCCDDRAADEALVATLIACAERGDAATSARAPTTPVVREAIGAECAVVVSGRCIDETGAPLAAAVHLQGVSGVRVGTRSGEDGTFCLHAEPAPGIAVQLCGAREDHVTTRIELGQLVAGSRRELGDVTLPRGCRVRGRVRDVHGAPVAGLRVDLLPTGQAWTYAPFGDWAETGADGTFALPSVLATGCWLARTPWREFVETGVLVVAAGARETHLELTLAEQNDPLTIAGVVLRPSGRPARGIEVAVRDAPQVVPALTDDREGTFRLVGWGVRADAQLVLTARDVDPVVLARPVRWGSEEVELRWPHVIGLEVRVVEADSARPLANAKVSVRPIRQVESLRVAGGRSDENGRFADLDVDPGTYQVSASAPGLVPLEIPHGTVREGRLASVELRMAAPVVRTVLVRDVDGAPIEGVNVVLWRHRPRPSDVSFLHAQVVGFDGGVQAWGDFGISSATTDASGCCALHAPANLVARVVCTSMTHPPVVLEPVSLAGVPEPWVVRLVEGATIEARFDASQASQIESVWLDRCGDEIGRGFAAEDCGSGRFRVAGLAAGNWRVAVQLRRPEWMRCPRVVVADVPALGVHETRVVELDLREPNPVRIRGTTRWNGRPCTEGLRLVREGAGASDPPAAILRPDVEGRFDATVPAGRYRVSLSHSGGGDGDLPFPEVVDALPGRAEVEVDLHLRTRAVQLRLRRAGHPLPGVTVQARGGPFTQTFAPADDHGRAEFALPLGVHRLVALPRRRNGEAVVLGEVVVVTGNGPQCVVLEVPAAWR